MLLSGYDIDECDLVWFPVPFAELGFIETPRCRIGTGASQNQERSKPEAVPGYFGKEVL